MADLSQIVTKQGQMFCGELWLQDDAISRRTSIEWCDSKGSGDLYDSIQEDATPQRLTLFVGEKSKTCSLDIF